MLGTFAISHDYACAPDPFDRQLLQTASYLAGIATENKLFETELIKEQKLESVGVLAGGIAHDFNNVLTAIMGNIELAMALTTPGREVHELLSAAAAALVRARDVTRQLLTFASGGVPVTSAESVGDVIRETVEFTLVGSIVRCETTFESDIQYVEIDRGQVGQVIQNILVMDDGESVREVIGAMLTALGYDVVFAKDGSEAVALFETRRDQERPFDLVLLDLTVRGGMGGAVALSRMKAIEPEVKAVATSGYSNSPILAHYKAHGFVGRLEKPFLAEELKAILSAASHSA